MKPIKLFVILLFLCLTTGLKAQQFKVGAACRNITPNQLLPISGGGRGGGPPAEGIKGDLFVRVMVFEKGNTRVAVVGIDNLGWPARLGDRSRELIKGIPPQNVLIGASHTHSAPSAYGYPDPSGNNAGAEYLDWCVKIVAEAVNEAVSKLEPAALKTAVGDAKGKIAYNYYGNILYDPRCGVIQAISASGANKGKVIATLVNYAIHPEILGPKRKTISPDLCGPLYDRIESKAGGMALFMNGAQGGMITADCRDENGKDVNTWEECIRIGNLLADEALRIISDAPVNENPDLFCTSREVTFPVTSDMMRVRSGNDDTKSIKTTVNLVNIGKVQALTIPGEALPNIGYYIKRNMKTDQPFLFGLTNDAFGYILTKVDFNSFERYSYVSRTSLGEMTGEIYIEEALKLVKESPAAQ